MFGCLSKSHGWFFGEAFRNKIAIPKLVQLEHIGEGMDCFGKVPELSIKLIIFWRGQSRSIMIMRVGLYFDGSFLTFSSMLRGIYRSPSNSDKWRFIEIPFPKISRLWWGLASWVEGVKPTVRCIAYCFWWSFGRLEINEEKDRSELPCFVERTVMLFDAFRIPLTLAGSHSLSKGCYKISKRFPHIRGPHIRRTRKLPCNDCWWTVHLHWRPVSLGILC